MGPLGICLLSLMSVPACDSTVEPSVIRGEARVTEVSVAILESFPVQAEAVVSGELPDGCTTIDTVETTREANVFRIRLTTARPAGAICTQAIVPFEERVRLDVRGLDAGEYRVVANGVSTTFRLDVDNG